MKTRALDDDIRRAAGRRGRYRLLRPVGASRFASLWKGEDTTTGEAVLVEVIRSAPPFDPEDAKVLRDRMAATQDLPTHPALLRVRSIHAPEPPGKLAVGSRAATHARARRAEELQWLLVLEPFDGSTLDHRAAFGDLSPAAVCAIAAKVGEALGALHAAGVAHGSVSPTSVLVSDDGDVRLIDAIVGSWWNARGNGVFADGERRREDVVALARLVTDLLSSVAVPLEVRGALATGAEPSLDELVTLLREAGASGSEVTAASVVEPELEPEAAAPEAELEPEPEPELEPEFDPAAARDEERELPLEVERHQERERVEAAQGWAKERARAEADARAEAERRRTAHLEARRLEHERRKHAEAEELRRQLARQEAGAAEEARRPSEVSGPQKEPEPEPEPPTVVVAPDATDVDDRSPDRRSDAPAPAEPERHVAAAAAMAETADRSAATSSSPRPAPEPVVALPHPPAVAPRSALDWTTGVPPAAATPTPRPALPSTQARKAAKAELPAEREVEPALWMKIVGVIASIAMFGAIAGAVYYMVQSS